MTKQSHSPKRGSKPLLLNNIAILDQIIPVNSFGVPRVLFGRDMQYRRLFLFVTEPLSEMILVTSLFYVLYSIIFYTIHFIFLGLVLLHRLPQLDSRVYIILKLFNRPEADPIIVEDKSFVVMELVESQHRFR